jgi:hypothetical protein
LRFEEDFFADQADLFRTQIDSSGGVKDHAVDESVPHEAPSQKNRPEHQESRRTLHGKRVPVSRLCISFCNERWGFRSGLPSALAGRP